MSTLVIVIDVFVILENDWKAWVIWPLELSAFETPATLNSGIISKRPTPSVSPWKTKIIKEKKDLFFTPLSSKFSLSKIEEVSFDFSFKWMDCWLVIYTWINTNVV